MPFDIGAVAKLTSPGDGTFTVASAADVPWAKVSTGGILTRSQMPFMRGQLSGKGNPVGGDGAALKMTADAQTGSCWNTATGLFTAPVAGYYIATAGNLCSATSGYFYLRKNGADMHYTHWNHSATWHWVSFSGIINCAANDYISWHCGSTNPAAGCFYGDSAHNMYSFALMA